MLSICYGPLSASICIGVSESTSAGSSTSFRDIVRRPPLGRALLARLVDPLRVEVGFAVGASSSPSCSPSASGCFPREFRVVRPPLPRLEAGFARDILPKSGSGSSRGSIVIRCRI